LPSTVTVIPDPFSSMETTFPSFLNEMLEDVELEPRVEDEDPPSLVD
jgi:hypothetical protein